MRKEKSDNLRSLQMLHGDLQEAIQMTATAIFSTLML